MHRLKRTAMAVAVGLAMVGRGVWPARLAQPLKRPDRISAGVLVAFFLGVAPVAFAEALWAH